MDRIKPHRVIGLYYDEKIDTEDVNEMLKSFNIKNYRVGECYVYLEFKDKQYFNCWRDYKCGDQDLDKYVIVA